MKILIAGLPKSGTTILTYRISEALGDCFVDFEPRGERDMSIGEGHQNVVTKKLFSDKGQELEQYDDYDKKIWIARDPRDFLISQALYRWYRSTKPTREDVKSFKAMKKTLLKKEKSPSKVPFIDLKPAHYTGPFRLVSNYREDIDDSWHIFRYEDMIDGRYDELNAFLGFEVKQEAEVDGHYNRVVRKKMYGDWRNWFTQTDVDFYSEKLERYMKVFGYDATDWRLNDPQEIEPEFASEYVTKLFNAKL